MPCRLVDMRSFSLHYAAGKHLSNLPVSLVSHLHHIYELYPEFLRAFISAFLYRTVHCTLRLGKGHDMRIRKLLQPDKVRALFLDSFKRNLTHWLLAVSFKCLSYSPNGTSPRETYLTPRGIARATQLFLFAIYYDQDFTPRLTTQQRDQQIIQRYKAGESISNLAREYGISPQRVSQIVNLKSKKEH